MTFEEVFVRFTRLIADPDGSVGYLVSCSFADPFVWAETG